MDVSQAETAPRQQIGFPRSLHHPPLQMGLRNTEPLTLFTARVESHLSMGHDIEGNQRPYFSRAAAKTWWTSQRVSQALNAHSDRSTADILTIQRDSPSFFSLLVYINKIPHLEREFHHHTLHLDNKYPISDCPSQWLGHTPIGGELYGAVRQYQWLFFPHSFHINKLADTDLEDECVLPIISMTKLRDGKVEGADIWLVNLDPEYNRLTVSRLVLQTCQVAAAR